MIAYPTSIDHDTGLETSVLGLRFILRPHLFTHGFFKVKCTASILELYYSSTEKVLYNADNRFKALMMEGRASSGGKFYYPISYIILNLVEHDFTLFKYVKYP